MLKALDLRLTVPPAEIAADPLVTNREWASLILLGLLVVVVLFLARRSGGLGSLAESLRAVFRSLVTRKIAIPLVLYVTLILATLILATRLDVWDPSLWKVAILWLVFSGFGLFLSLGEAIEDPSFFRRALLRTLGAVAAVEFIANLESFPLWAEILGQLLAFFAVLTRSLTEHAGSRRLANVCLTPDTPIEA